MAVGVCVASPSAPAGKPGDLAEPGGPSRVLGRGWLNWQTSISDLTMSIEERVMCPVWSMSGFAAGLRVVDQSPQSNVNCGASSPRDLLPP